MRVLILSFLLSALLPASLLAQKMDPIRVATYNIRYDTPKDGPNAWPNRRENVKGLIRYHEFDIMGTQEGLLNQLNDLSQMPGFARIGKGRDDGKEGGEHSAIFYRKDRFSVLQSGDFWLSETPDKPSLGWDATCCNRICSWAKLRDQRSRKEFYVFNVHFDHQGVEARRQSGKLLVQKISEIAKNAPVICTGDFNSTPDTEQIQTMQTRLNDAYRVTATPPYGPVGTFNAFAFDAPMKDRIDYIFVSKDIDVLSYAVLTDANQQRYPSDHQPVVIKAVIR